jgi:hypothetical protein
MTRRSVIVTPRGRRRPREIAATAFLDWDALRRAATPLYGRTNFESASRALPPPFSGWAAPTRS